MYNLIYFKHLKRSISGSTLYKCMLNMSISDSANVCKIRAFHVAYFAKVQACKIHVVIIFWGILQ